MYFKTNTHNYRVKYLSGYSNLILYSMSHLVIMFFNFKFIFIRALKVPKSVTIYMIIVQTKNLLL